MLLSLTLLTSPVNAMYASGKMLADNCNSEQPEGIYSCMNYIAGVIDYHTFMQSMGTTDSGVTFCLPKDATIEEASVVVMRYLKTMPEQEAFIAASTVMMALKTAYPCAK